MSKKYTSNNYGSKNNYNIFLLKKKKENLNPLNSVLNPEINSDSASLKSNGARWVSAKIQIPHIGNKIKFK